MNRVPPPGGSGVTPTFPKVTSYAGVSSSAAIATSNLPEISAGGRGDRDTENPANRPDRESWRARAQSKATWLGARILGGSPLGAIEQLATLRAEVEDALREEVERARAQGEPWSRIGPAIGTTPEAARQRYGARS